MRSLQSRSRNRKKDKAFVAEGVRLIEEALNAHWPCKLILYDATLSDRGQALVKSKSIPEDTEIAEIPPELMVEISDTETPQGILAVLEQEALRLPVSPTFLIIADQIRDPGNMGTLLRTAEAFGADGVLLAPGTVDVFSPKVVRAGMGAHFHLPIRHMPWPLIKKTVEMLPVFVADASQGIPMWEANLQQPCVLLIGGEAFGASPEGIALSTNPITIPMPGPAESLNAAIAAGILMAEVLRQRFLKGK